MHEFKGIIYLLTEPDSVFDARVKLDLTRIAVIADGAEIGSWKLSEVTVARIGDLIHLTADGETLVLDLEGRDFLLDLLGVTETRPQQSKRRGSVQHDEPTGPNRFSLANLKTEILEERTGRLDSNLAILMGAAAAAILLGAALTWGPIRLLDPGSFPVGRLLAGFGGLGGLLGLYLAYFDRSRVTGSAAAIAAGVVTFAITYLYARSAHLGIGFVLALLGSQALVAVGIVGMVRRPGGDQ